MRGVCTGTLGVGWGPPIFVTYGFGNSNKLVGPTVVSETRKREGVFGPTCVPVPPLTLSLYMYCLYNSMEYQYMVLNMIPTSLICSV